MTTPSDSKSSREPRPPQKPSSEVGHERPIDDPGRGQGDVLDDKIPAESPTAGSNRPSGSGGQESARSE